MQKNHVEENKLLASSDNASKIKDNLRFIRNLDEVKAWFYFTRGDIYALKKDFDKAISDYQTAISLNPQNERKIKEKIISIQQQMKK